MINYIFFKNEVAVKKLYRGFIIAALLFVLIALGVFLKRDSVVTMAAPTYDYSSIRIDGGDTLNSIYTRYRAECSFGRDEFIDRVVYMNGLKSADSIHADAYIVIPVRGVN